MIKLRHETLSCVMQISVPNSKPTTFGETPFPAVTVCSVNGYKAPLLKHIPSFENLFDAFDTATSNFVRNRSDIDENTVVFEVFTDITGRVMPILATTTTYCGCAYVKSERDRKCFIAGNIANASHKFNEQYSGTRTVLTFTYQKLRTLLDVKLNLLQTCLYNS
uniref:Uncharacterized protein n=1 Tax=Acrobeloides nanus TaxID=290746 RepID=A0A914D0U3_9BILA